MSLSPAARQAAYLTGGVWTLSGLLYMVPLQIFRGGGGAYVAVTVTAISVVGMLLSGLVYSAARGTRRGPKAVRVAAMVISVAGAAALLALFDASFSRALVHFFEPATQPPDFAYRAVNNFTALLWQFALLGAVYAVLEANDLARERERHLAEAREAAGRAEGAASAANLAALRYQINPHLLFNALNAASSLVINRRNEEAEATLAKLADFLRSTLVADTQAIVTLGREIATTEAYLEVEAVRFGERLEVRIECPPELEAARVPSFVLQPLAENAVKYAVSPTRRPVTLRIGAVQVGEELMVTVEDDGDPAEAAGVPKGTGVGLANVRQRLEMLYGERGNLWTEFLPHGFRATVRLPLVVADERRMEAAA